MKEVDVLGKEQLFVSDMLWSLMLCSKVSEILGYPLIVLYQYIGTNCHFSDCKKAIKYLFFSFLTPEMDSPYQN